jgi:hypothetical protein
LRHEYAASEHSRRSLDERRSALRGKASSSLARADQRSAAAPYR